MLPLEVRYSFAPVDWDNVNFHVQVKYIYKMVLDWFELTEPRYDNHQPTNYVNVPHIEEWSILTKYRLGIETFEIPDPKKHTSAQMEKSS